MPSLGDIKFYITEFRSASPLKRFFLLLFLFVVIFILIAIARKFLSEFSLEFLEVLVLTIPFFTGSLFAILFKKNWKLFCLVPFGIGIYFLLCQTDWPFTNKKIELISPEVENNTSFPEATSDTPNGSDLFPFQGNQTITGEESLSHFSTTEIFEISSTIAITEVMASPCNSDYPSSNEYIELYNYGKEPIDVGGWYFSLSGKDVTPDRIVSWEARNNQYGLGKDVIINSTVIQPGYFAIILPSNYHVSTEQNLMPYSFPPKTIILTMEEGTYLVNETYGIQGWKTTTQVSGVYIYIGTSSRIDQVISTYGIDVQGLSPKNQTNFRDQMPIGTDLCYSVQRRIASGTDTIGNWSAIMDGNPGYGTDDY